MYLSHNLSRAWQSRCLCDQHWESGHVWWNVKCVIHNRLMRISIPYILRTARLGSLVINGSNYHSVAIDEIKIAGKMMHCNKIKIYSSRWKFEEPTDKNVLFAIDFVYHITEINHSFLGGEHYLITLEMLCPVDSWMCLGCIFWNILKS